MHNRAEARYRNVVAEVVADLAARDRPGARRRRAVGPPRSSTRASASARRPTTTSRCWATSTRCGCWAGRSCWARRASRRSGRLLDLPAGPARRGDARDDGARRSRPASTSSASTTSARTSGPRASRTRSSAAGGRRAGPRRRRRVTRPHRARGHGVPGHATASTSTSSVTPQPFEVDVELALNLQPAGLTDDLALTVDYSRVFDDLPPDRRVDAVPPASRRSPRRSRHEVLADFHADEVTVRVRKPAVDLGGTFRAVGIEIAAAPDRADRRPPRRSATGCRARPEGDRRRSSCLAVAQDVERHRVVRRELARAARRAGAPGRSWIPLIERMMSPSLMPGLRRGAAVDDRRTRRWPPAETQAPLSTVRLVRLLDLLVDRLEADADPRAGVSASPATACSMIGLAMSIGMAKPMPDRVGGDGGVDAHDVRRRRRRSGPPELPGLIAASVWIRFVDPLAAVDRDVAALAGHDAARDRERVRARAGCRWRRRAGRS